MCPLGCYMKRLLKIEQAKASERQANKRQEAGSQPSERQGRQPAEKSLEARGKARPSRPSQAGKARANKKALGLSLFLLLLQQPAAGQATSKAGSRQRGRQASSRQTSQPVQAYASAQVLGCSYCVRT